MQLEYYIKGESNKKTILFVHGAGANASQFEKQLEFFSDRYKVVSLSLRGHGGSALPTPNVTPLYSLDHLANDIIELIEKLKLDHKQNASSQTNPFMSDFDYLLKKLEETHPDPHTGFGGLEGFIQKKNHFAELMKEDLTPEAFLMLLNQFLSSLNDGHTFANFPDNSAKRVSTFFNLPATNISVSISNARQVLYSDEDERGKIIRPDFEMSLEEYSRLGFDANAEILRALEVINMKRQ